ncbi:uncharacterized protein B0T23DRAFT_376161 [Neurospora hispaniola]|uniref:Uncharacterized protein n=1 Tax=Neurospora hispaniola TaxID=588809 RepID=A0AAJ0MS75_9PEZI|nr:hypothetical protein B0T23DRAFT_376161 [Neurospora hispaniola]
MKARGSIRHGNHFSSCSLVCGGTLVLIRPMIYLPMYIQLLGLVFLSFCLSGRYRFGCLVFGGSFFRSSARAAINNLSCALQV